MRSQNGRYIITYNGEIYNYPDLRKILAQRGATFNGASDTEVLLEGYSHFGQDVLSHLNGIFAFGIVDLEKRELFLARDQLGIKPLYVWEGPAGVAFASEIKSLLCLPGISRELDPIALGQYLTYLWCPGERTPLKAIKKLAPGTAMVIREGRVCRVEKYWTFPAYAPRRSWTEKECATEIGDTITRSVSRQMVSDVPLGAFLSGGLDSTAIVAAARLQAPNLHCYTAAMTSDVAGEMTSDLPYARLAAQALNVRMTEVAISPQDIADGLQDMIRQLDEPLADPACLITKMISQVARADGIKVLLSGVGGDDLFSGYSRHAVATLNPALSYVPGPARALAAHWSASAGHRSHASRRVAKALKDANRRGDERLAGLFAWTGQDVARAVINRSAVSDADLAAAHSPLIEELASAKALPDLEKCLILDRRFFLTDHNLNYTDKMGMSAGVEIRVPLLDMELVKLAATVPTEWKTRRLHTKWILKQSQRGRIPDAIIDRPKTGFGVPLRSWMQNGLAGMTADLLSIETVRRRGLFNAEAVQKLRVDNASGRVDASYTLFSVMCIELWCRHFIDDAVKLAGI